MVSSFTNTANCIFAMQGGTVTTASPVYSFCKKPFLSSTGGILSTRSPCPMRRGLGKPFSRLSSGSVTGSAHLNCTFTLNGFAGFGFASIAKVTLFQRRFAIGPLLIGIAFVYDSCPFFLNSDITLM